MPAAASVIQDSGSASAYVLLQLIRKYVELDMYLSFEVQMNVHLKAWKKAVREFEELLDVCHNDFCCGLY